MTRQKLISSSLAGATLTCATLLGIALLAQDNPPLAPAQNMDITGLPGSRGVYVRTAGRWLGLSHTVLMPFDRRRSVTLEILNVGSDHAVAPIPGAHAGLQIANDTRPTFYMRGIRPTQMYLVRAITKAEYRELLMPISRNFYASAQFRPEDVNKHRATAVAADVVTVKPFAALRHIIGGITTEKGLREYLVLLSISETCKYIGVDFLDFLRSGEKDIHAFADGRTRARVTLRSQ